MYDNESTNETAAENADAIYTRHFSDFVSSCGQVGGEVAWTTIAELLDRCNVPILYRVYAHMVLAHGPSNRLYRAEKAVEHAEWNMRNLGDRCGGLELLALAKRTLKNLLESELIHRTGQGNTGHEEK